VQLAPIALDDRDERPVVPVAGEDDQALVALRAQQRVCQPRRHEVSIGGRRRWD
jgi:hypothetical protein